MNTGKSPDEYGLTAEHFKSAKNLLTPIITKVFNQILKEKAVPTSFKTGIITPVLKKGKDAKRMENYRGITVSGSFSKLFEYTVLNKLDLDQSSQQFGFTEGLSPIMAGLLVSEAKAEAQHIGTEGLYLATLDSQKAFDVVHHSILFDKLAAKGVTKDIWQIVKNLYQGLSSKVKWISGCSESFPIHQGVKQGGVLSTTLYKTYIDEFLDILECKRLGFRIGTVFVGSPACCDDIAFLTKSKDELQIMFNEGKRYSEKHRYEIHPTKTNIVDLVNGSKVNDDMTWNLGDNTLSFSDTAVHLGVTRAGKKESDINIDERISLARRTSYSLMNTGLHGANGLSPEVSYQIYKIYVFPRLLYGLEIIPLNKTQLEKINRYHVKTLRNLQSLPQRTATSAVYLLLGALPIEGELHKRLLSLLYSVIKSENKCLQDLVERQLACSFNNLHSFFNVAGQILLKYELPSLNELVISDISKFQWKRTCIKAIHSFWTKVFVKDAKSKKSLKYLETSSLRVGSAHLVWRDLETAAQVKRSIVRARILTGTYTLQANRHTFSKKTVDSTCNHCQLEAEDLQHMVCRCPVFYEYRNVAVKQLKDIVLQKCEYSVWDCHFTSWSNILRVLVCPDFIQHVLPDLKNHVKDIEQISRELFYKIHVKKLQLQQG